MILLDKPYVSPFLLQTIREHNLPVVLTDAARAFGVDGYASAITEQEAEEMAQSSEDLKVYSVSENSIAWIAEHLATTGLPDQIERFKDKARFRRDTASLFPSLQFHELAAEELRSFDPSSFAMPFIVKPTVGFFSLGVQCVRTVEDWDGACSAIETDLARARSLFPSEVLDTSRLLIESCIVGREFAVDAYFDSQGKPVILSILEHLFASDTDTSDRVYVTSAEIVRANLERFTRLLKDIGEQISVRNFAVHLELRVDSADKMWPIEINPVRFGGWCTTADLTNHAFGLNPYACFFEQERPDWNQALSGKQGQIFGLIALGNTTGVESAEIESFDYEGLLSRFANPLELRKTDFREYPIFGFVFMQTESQRELDWALHASLREFVTEV